MKQILNARQFKTPLNNAIKALDNSSKALDNVIYHSVVHVIRTQRPTFFNQLLARLNEKHKQLISPIIAYALKHLNDYLQQVDKTSLGTKKGVKPISISYEDSISALEKMEIPVFSVWYQDQLTNRHNADNDDDETEKKPYIYELEKGLERMAKRLQRHYDNNEIADNEISLLSAFNTFLPLIKKGIDRYTLEKLISENQSIDALIETETNNKAETNTVSA